MHITGSTKSSAAGRWRILQSALTGAIVSGILFAGCWLLALTPFSATHGLIPLFTTADITSSTALIQGLCWSLIFGAWIGFLIAVVNRIVTRTVTRR